jgi:hypothetical protein
VGGSGTPGVVQTGLSGAGGTSSTPGATLTDIAPGGAYDPLNWLGDVASAGGSSIASGILGVIETVTAPLVKFLEDSTLVILGVVLLIVGLIVLAHSADDSNNSAQSSAPGGGAKKAPKSEAEEGAEAAVVAA